MGGSVRDPTAVSLVSVRVTVWLLIPIRASFGAAMETNNTAVATGPRDSCARGSYPEDAILAIQGREAPMAEMMAQVNVRMPLTLKQAGDDAFAVAGLSPSAVVRAVYERAAELSHSIRGISDIVAGDESRADLEEERQRKMAVFERSAHIIEDVAERYGLKVDVGSYEPMTDEEIEEAMYSDYLAEGTL